MASASDLNRGSYFMLNNEPVQVTRKEVVAYGTHSHTKLKIYYKSIEGGGDKTLTMAHGDKVEILDIIKKTGQIISKASNKAQIMDMKSFETIDAEATPEIITMINEGDEVIYIEFNGMNKILEKK